MRYKSGIDGAKMVEVIESMFEVIDDAHVVTFGPMCKTQLVFWIASPPAISVKPQRTFDTAFRFRQVVHGSGRFLKLRLLRQGIKLLRSRDRPPELRPDIVFPE